ncbi:MAG: large conductance mechanosensitive channel protein MscL [Christensenellales bacterium]
MKKLKAFFAEFKKFISRGNVVDMAIGVIVASAFTAIVTSLTNKIIMPCINWLLSLGGTNGLESAYTFLKRVYTIDAEGNQVVDLAKSIYIDWGAFLTAILNFFIIAFILFLILKAFNAASKFTKEMNQKIITLSKRELKKLKKQGLNEEEIQKIEQQKAQETAAQQPPTPPKPTTDELLADILKELKKQNAETEKIENGENKQTPQPDTTN